MKVPSDPRALEAGEEIHAYHPGTTALLAKISARSRMSRMTGPFARWGVEGQRVDGFWNAARKKMQMAANRRDLSEPIHGKQRVVLRFDGSVKVVPSDQLTDPF